MRKREEKARERSDELIFERKSDLILLSDDVKTREIGLDLYFKLLFTRDGDLQLQERGQEHYYDCAYNAIVMRLEDNDKRKGSPQIILKDLDDLAYCRGRKFAITAPITYVGNKRNSRNARLLYGFAIDLDCVGEKQMIDVLYQMRNSVIPRANIIVNSGHGLHLYYLIDKPIPLFESTQKLLNDFKKDLTFFVWNPYTSYSENKQYQNILQGFRLPETQTKFGELVRAFQCIEQPLWTFEDLNNWLYKKGGNYGLKPHEVQQVLGIKFESKSKLTLEKAKERYPEWYERRIVRGQKKGRWYIKKALYDWWLKKLREEGDAVKEGHRYNCVLTLVIFGKKCEVGFEKIENDAYSLLEPFEEITKTEDNHFTEEDIKDALKMYKEDIVTYPRNSIEYITGIRIDANKRNGRKRDLHLKLARMQKKVLIEAGEVKEGRPKSSTITAKDSPHAKKIAEWRSCNPNGNKSECARSLGFSRNTVSKWW